MTLALIGAGQRGIIYAQYAVEAGVAVVAAADPNAEHLAHAKALFGLNQAQAFDSGEALLEKPKLADAVIIASMDQNHYAHVMAALERGYDVLLEKPISPSARECLTIAQKAKQTGRKITVCHVLRYSPFFREIKRILDEQTLGRVISIQHNENIGNFHMAHSFVRGNWRKSETSSPIIMQKSCHDLDLLVWYAGSACKRISSFGGLSYFNAAHAPVGAAMRCADCKYKDTCRFSAYVCYPPCRGQWPASVLSVDQSEEGLNSAIRNGPYGRCVYHCDNDVCDHQTVNIEFENGVTATFNLSAFTAKMCRTMKIMCENGEIRASEDQNRIEIIPFTATAGARCEQTVILPGSSASGHNGGDGGLMNDFLALMDNRLQDVRSDIAVSIESHLMACAAEKARLESSVVDMRAYREALSREDAQ